MSSEKLVKVLKARKEQIVDDWIRAVHESGPMYASRPVEELRQSLLPMVEGVTLAVEKNDYSVMFDLIRAIAKVRGRTGFSLGDVQKAIMLGVDVIMGEIIRSCAPEESQECFEAIRKLVEVMNWSHLGLGDAFSDVLQKEFSAGTLVALSAAQSDFEEEGIIRKSLDECCRLLGFERGAVLLRYRTEFSAAMPLNTADDEALFRAIGAKAIKTGEAVNLEPAEPKARKTRQVALRTAVGLPIMARGKILGALLLGSPVQKTMSQHEMDFAKAVTSQIGLACENARLLKDAKHRGDKFKGEYEELFTILSQLGAFVYVSDMDNYSIIAVNRFIEDAFGKDLIGKKCYERLQNNPEGPCSFCTNRYLLKDGVPTGPYTWKNRNPVTGNWYQCIDRAIHWPDGKIVRMEVAFDVTELETARAKLEEARRMLELFNDLLVHDVSNYAGVARSYLELLRDAPETAQKNREDMIRTALVQMRRIEELIDRVSKLNRAQTLGQSAMDVRDLASILEEVVADQRDAPASSAVEIRTEYARGVHFVRLGEFGRDIFLNLLSNAVKYGEGKPVIILISDSTLQRRPAWKVSFTDQGKGIPPEKRLQLFRRFERLDSLSKLKGIGLGLTLVRSLTDIYGGEVLVEDRVVGDYAQGTVTSVTFPKA